MPRLLCVSAKSGADARAARNSVADSANRPKAFNASPRLLCALGCSGFSRNAVRQQSAARSNWPSARYASARLEWNAASPGRKATAFSRSTRGLGKLALLLPQDSQHFQGVDLLGIAAENGRVATRGRGEMPGLIKLKCVGQILLQSDDHHIGSASAHTAKPPLQHECPRFQHQVGLWVRGRTSLRFDLLVLRVDLVRGYGFLAAASGRIVSQGRLVLASNPGICTVAIRGRCLPSADLPTMRNAPELQHRSARI